MISIKPRGRSFFRDIVKIFLSYRLYLCAIVAFSLVFISINIIKPYILSLVFDKGIDRGSLSLILQYTFDFFLIMIFMALLSISNQYVFSSYANKFVYEARVLIINHIVDLPKHFFDANSMGDIVTRVNDDVQDIRNYLLYDVTAFYQSVLSFTGATIFIGIMQWRILIANLAILPLMAFALHFSKKMLYESSFNMKQSLSASNKELLDGFRNINELKAIGFEHYFAGRVFHKFGDLLAKNVRNSVVQESASSSIQFIVNLTYLVTIGYGGYLILRGQMTVGMLLAFLTMRSQLVAPVQSWSNLYTRYFVVKASLDRLDAYYCQKKEDGLEIANPNCICECGVKPLRFDKMHFTYTTMANESPSIFLDDEFGGGEWVGIKGRSGIGKTTLLRLILKLIKPSNGKIYYGDQSLKSFNNREWRNELGYVSQRTLALNETLKENILMGRGGVTDEHLREVLMICCLDEIVETLANKIETTIDENGAIFSEGMLKRLMLARAIVKPKRILLLDEFFSALDLGLAKRVAKNLKYSLPFDATVIIVSHRDADFELCNKLVNMDQVFNENCAVEQSSKVSPLGG